MKKAIVIGATSGIGNNLAEVLIENNYKVGITGRRTGLLLELKQKNPSLYHLKTMDITNIENTINQLEELTCELGGLDLIVICSGIGDINNNLDFSIEKNTIDTNVIGFTNIADWAFNYFQMQKFGHLVAISSVGGLRGSKQAPSYNATKAFQINYLEALRQKAKALKTDIHITDARPGFVNTAMAKGDGLFWVAPVEKATLQLYKAIVKKKKIVYISKRWRIIASIMKKIPRPIYDKM